MTEKLLKASQAALQNKGDLPFFLYSSIHPQNLHNITITQPTLIFVLRGHKTIGQPIELVCDSGQFVFLADHQLTVVRNIPKDREYLAFILAFDAQDFVGIPSPKTTHEAFISGQTSPELLELIEQLAQIAKWAPESILQQRKNEIIMLLYNMGYHGIASFGSNNTLSHKIHTFFQDNQFQNLSIETLCDKLLMSETTLRRRLQAEKQSIKNIKDNAQLGHGLHLLQTSQYSIQQIAEHCGYQSHSRFTENFKLRFGLTPSELRKTKAM